jgi:hypothetical protein
MLKLESDQANRYTVWKYYRMTLHAMPDLHVYFHATCSHICRGGTFTHCCSCSAGTRDLWCELCTWEEGK